MKPIFQKNTIIIGNFLGDEAKGATVDYLTAQEPINSVVKFSGGSQSAHNVVTHDGRHHTFAQFGAGSFNGVRTILSKHVLVNPFDLVTEGLLLLPKAGWDVFSKLLISESALMTTPVHVAINRKRERLRGVSAHGSCGLGIGETQNFANHHPDFAPRIYDLLDFPSLEMKLRKVFEFAEEQVGDISDLTPPLPALMESYRNLAEDKILNLMSDDRILDELTLGYNVFEGSQGVLLDENYGFHPNTTWSTVTSSNAQQLLLDAGLEPAHVVGCVRSYATRHGYGPFPSEILDHDYFEAHNGFGEFQGSWRAGLFDLPLFEYAVRANGGVDSLAVSHLDVPVKQVISRYPGFPEIPSDFFAGDRVKQEEITNLLTELAGSGVVEDITDEQGFLDRLESLASAPVQIKGYGPTKEDRVFV